jgi:Tfp pilus assembly protein PilX
MITMNDKTSSSKPSLYTSQNGVVSLLVTMVLMIVISLIALGFAQVARRNQNQELDQQLSTQAFYAAESGVNDVANLVSTQLAAGTQATDLVKPTCSSTGPTGLYATLLPTLGNGVSYTCVLVNPYPPILKTDVTSTSEIIPISATSPITKLTLQWSPEAAGANPVTGCPGSVSLPTIAQWGACKVGLLRIDLVPSDVPPTDAATLAKETLTTFVVPMKPSGAGPTNSIPYPAVNADTANRNNIVGVDCTNNSTPSCTFNITTAGHTGYYLRVLSQYEDSALQISADDATGPEPLSGAQVIIDATGKAQNVLRRIQVYAPIGIMSNQLSDYAVESTDSICKRFAVMSNYFVGDDNPAGTQSNNPTLDPLCQ